MGWEGSSKKKDGGVSHPLQKSGARCGEAEGQRQQRAWSMEHGGRSVERQHGARSMEHGARGMETEARIKGCGAGRKLLEKGDGQRDHLEKAEH